MSGTDGGSGGKETANLGWNRIFFLDIVTAEDLVDAGGGHWGCCAGYSGHGQGCAGRGESRERRRGS